MSPVLQILWLDDADRTVPLPAYESAGAAGADLRANLPAESRAAGITLAPMQRGIIPTGFCVEVPEGYEMQIRPRSGLALKHGITLLNSPGTVDGDYRGPVGVLLINLGQQRFVVRHGERIAQLVVAPVVQVATELSQALSDTRRGAGGFGSTGRG